ncbi:hypothetical protein MMC25_007615 [Agyrium rufum]|nr:hypothetical protein [Agyrium rufum]
MSVQTILDVLNKAADTSTSRGLLIYSSGSAQTPTRISYRDLREQALHNSQLLREVDDFSQGSIILLHFNNQLDNITWFWSVVLAGCIPAISTPFTNNSDQREKHIQHLHNLFQDPICLTRTTLLDEFAGRKILKLKAVDEWERSKHQPRTSTCSRQISPSDVALLMLTSGSTGNAKAVCLSHEQMLKAVDGKSGVVQLADDHPFLNWIGLDHVASMVEMHLQAMFLGVDQVHIPPAEVIASPWVFLELIDRHRVTRSFAPNFFLAKLRKVLESRRTQGRELNIDLSCLHNLASGGEANLVDTCAAVSRLLGEYGAPPNVIIPGFGMTETCAGAIYNSDCPRYDLKLGLEFASVGHCMPGIQMRIMQSSEPGVLAAPGEPGNLEISGPLVFKEYFNNTLATSEAFTEDGWFRTGDQAIIDSFGNLNLIGRVKDTMIINGTNHLPVEVENALDEASIPGLTISYNVCFSFRPDGAQSEQICIVYLPTYDLDDAHRRIQTLDSIVKTVMLHTGVRPHVLPLDNSILQKSTLGKLPRTRIRTAFQRGDYQSYQEVNDELVKLQRAASYSKPDSELEQLLLGEFVSTLELANGEMGVDTPVFAMGVTSIDIIKLKRRIEARLGLPTNQIPMIMMMTNPTVRSLGSALQRLNQPAAYDPVVPLQLNGTKNPLWLIHPGVGEVLVFLGLSKFLTDRPVFALRARGFNSTEKPFNDITEAVSIYHTAIKKRQPHGPYALAGYSYGSMLAFELAKVLEANGDAVKFLGSFNLPPHIRARMQQLDWTQCILHLSFFLDLLPESAATDLSPELKTLSRADALARICTAAAPARMAELSLTPAALGTWADLAFSLQSMARDYEPSGSVECMDVFIATPLAAVAQNRHEWRYEQLSRWGDFVRGELRFHDVGGAHYTMIGPEYVFGFQKTLKAALEARGL